MRKGRKKDHVWQFAKYKGDIGIYATCSCGFLYSCCENINEVGVKMIPSIEKLYPYCPCCGSRKTKYTEEVKKIDRYPWQ